VRIHHIALRVSDLAACRRFYAEILGLEPLESSSPPGFESVWFRTGDAVLMLERSLRGRGPERGSGHVLALEVTDLSSWERRLASAGVTIDDRTERTLYVRDPEGHRVALSVYRFPTSPESSTDTRS